MDKNVFLVIFALFVVVIIFIYQNLLKKYNKKIKECDEARLRHELAIMNYAKRTKEYHKGVEEHYKSAKMYEDGVKECVNIVCKYKELVEDIQNKM